MTKKRTPLIKLDAEEQAILSSFEKGEWESVFGLERQKKSS